MNQTDNTLQPLAWAGGQVTPAVVPSAPAAVGEARRWRALSGASMRQVLQAWAEEGNINLIWLAKQDFAVRSSVNQSVDFARAANDLLQQYAFEPMRPVGQIYIDPATRQKTLVVRAAVR